MAIGSCLWAASNAPPKPRLLAAVRREGIALTIENQDLQDWDNVRVEINDRFRCHIDRIEASATRRVALVGCIADDGMRFNPIAMAPVSVFVTAALAKDDGEASNLFQFQR